MALSILRKGLHTARVIGASVRLSPMVNKTRTIVSKQFREKDPDAPAPWPYETRKFNLLETLFENTQDRFNENTRIIVVEGNIGVGKSYLAKRLAEELDFLLFPEANLDMMYIDDEGFDVRSLNHMVPESTRPYDIAAFYKNPKTVCTPDFQYSMLGLRYEQYLDALAHLLNTGQGVILERSPYTDFVFADAMHKFGYLNDYDMEVYYKMKKNCTLEIFKPHLVIYLDAPTDVLLKNIKKRGTPAEQNTSVLTPEYLAAIDEAYKEKYLPTVEKECELISYDWATFGDPHMVTEDIERLPIDALMDDWFSPKFRDWKGHNTRAWDHYRMKFTNEKDVLMEEAVYSVARTNPMHFNTPFDDIAYCNKIYDKHIPNPYSKGFNRDNFSSYFRSDYNYRDIQRKDYYRTR